MFGAYHNDMQRAYGRIRAAGSATLRTRFGVIEYVDHGAGFPLLVSHGVLGCHVDGVDGYWSGGLIIFDADSWENAEQLAGDDPFQRHDLLHTRWLKEWTPDTSGS